MFFLKYFLLIDKTVVDFVKYLHMFLKFNSLAFSRDAIV